MVIAEKDPKSLPVVPQTAVLQDREGRYVFVVKDDNTVAQTRITTGPRVETGWAVTEGLQGGEQVVIEGVQRLQNGMTVATAAAPEPEKPQNATAPEAPQGGDPATESAGDAP